MGDFPINAYISARRYKAEQDAQNPWADAGTAMGGGFAAGAVEDSKRRQELEKLGYVSALQERADAKKLKAEGFIKYMTDNNIVPVKYVQGQLGLQQVPVSAQDAAGMLTSFVETGKVPDGIYFVPKAQKKDEGLQDQSAYVYDEDSDTIERVPGFSYKAKPGDKPMLIKKTKPKDKSESFAEQKARNLAISMLKNGYYEQKTKDGTVIQMPIRTREEAEGIAYESGIGTTDPSLAGLIGQYPTKDEYDTMAKEGKIQKTWFGLGSEKPESVISTVGQYRRERLPQSAAPAPAPQVQFQMPNDKIGQRILQARQMGISDEKIKNDLIQVGIDPLKYGIR